MATKHASPVQLADYSSKMLVQLLFSTLFARLLTTGVSPVGHLISARDYTPSISHLHWQLNLEKHSFIEAVSYIHRSSTSGNIVYEVSLWSHSKHREKGLHEKKLLETISFLNDT